MISLIICIAFAFVLSFLLLYLGFLVSFYCTFRDEKSSPFECGFDPISSARIPFSTRFFLLAVIFLVFDIEIALIMPIPVLINYRLQFEVVLGSCLFLLILFLGLLHEWREGSLDWEE